MLSDDSTSDSDSGIRFKTDSTRRLPEKREPTANERRRDGRNPREPSPAKRNESRHRERSNREERYAPSKSRHDSSRSSNTVKRHADDDRHHSDRKYRRSVEEDDRKRERSAEHKSSKSSKHNIGIDKHSRNSRDRIVHTKKNEEFASNMRMAINRHLNLGKDDKNRPSKDNKNGNSDKLEHKTKVNIHDDKGKTLNSNFCEESVQSDDERRPMSYYNLGYQKPEEIHESISVSTEDEDVLREKALLLKEKLKKKSKHKQKKKSHDKVKYKNENKRSVDNENSVNNDRISPDLRKKKSENNSCGNESNEEGEILSDSDENPSSIVNKQRVHNCRLPDLREKLSINVTLEDIPSGPALPPHMRVESEDDLIEGPALPPHLMSKNEKNIGPVIPDAYRRILENETKTYTISDDEKVEDSDDNIEIVGPLPHGSEEKWSTSHRKLEERALKLKMESLDGQSLRGVKMDQREEWMMKLPDTKGLQLGLTSRQFRAREGPDLSDRSSWTDTPHEKALKAAGIYPEDDKVDSTKVRQSAEADFIRKRDQEQEIAVRKHKKKNKRDTSLLEMHEKKLKKKKKKNEESKEKVERRRFDRDIDLKANRFDEAQKKAILKKAQLLDTRFSRGESKFL